MFGITWEEHYLWYQERGIRPFTNLALAGKTIPMWVNDEDGSEAQKIPAADRERRTRRTQDGRQQVLIFRKAAPIGSTKTVTNRQGRRVVVPRSYPGAPGRISQRDQFGRIVGGNVGVRWRHPGMGGKDFMMDSLRQAASSLGIEPLSINFVRL